MQHKSFTLFFLFFFCALLVFSIIFFWFLLLLLLFICVCVGGVEKFNHIIVTKYDQDGDCIGWHNDKEKNFVDGTGFAVVTFGDARSFQFRKNPSAEDSNPAVCWDTELAQGSLLVVSGEANRRYQHRVIKSVSGSPSRTSIVFRSIKTVISQSDYKKKKTSWTKRNRERAQRRQLLVASEAASEAHTQPMIKEDVSSGEETETDDYTKLHREERILPLDEEETESDQEDENPPKRAKAVHI